MPAVDDPFVKVNGLITDLVSELQAETSSEVRHKPHCEDESAKTWDPETRVTTHSSRLSTVKKFDATAGEDPFADVKATKTEGLEQVPVIQTVRGLGRPTGPVCWHDRRCSSCETTPSTDLQTEQKMMEVNHIQSPVHGIDVPVEMQQQMPEQVVDTVEIPRV